MLPRFHLITDFGPLDRNALTRLLAFVGKGAVGTPRVDAVQVRAKQASDREVVAWTRELLAEDPDPPGAAREIAELVHTS